MPKNYNVLEAIVPAKEREQMSKKHNVLEAIYFLEGWFAANPPQSMVKERLDIIIEAAKDMQEIRDVAKEMGVVNLTEKVLSIQEEKEEEKEELLPGSKTEEEKEEDIEKRAVLHALKTKTFNPLLIPAHFDEAVTCHRCTHLIRPEDGRGYNVCSYYNMKVRSAYAERVCDSFDRGSNFVVASITCVTCNHFKPEEAVCTALDIRIIDRTENKYGLCSCWQTRFKEPVKKTQVMKNLDKLKRGDDNE